MVSLISLISWYPSYPGIHDYGISCSAFKSTPNFYLNTRARARRGSFGVSASGVTGYGPINGMPLRGMIYSDAVYGYIYGTYHIWHIIKGPQICPLNTPIWPLVDKSIRI
jgi:hypothetical protein